MDLTHFSDYFSDEAIINRLCKERIKDANKRHKALFHRQIRSDAKMPKDSNALDCFPPRTKWRYFRKGKLDRNRCAGEDHNLIALIRATFVLRRETPNEGWVQRLNRKIEEIRDKALQNPNFSFESPEIHGAPKAKDSSEYRAIAKFNRENRIIEGITAKYLRQVFDKCFTDSSLAFRCAVEGAGPPTHHDAVKMIKNYRCRHSSKGLYVAECDIKGFYDNVSHQVAIQSLVNLSGFASKKDSGFRLAPRAEIIFRAYLDCYNFPRNVTLQAEPRLKERKGEAAVYKWHEDALKEFHKNPRMERIGVPQGGAISCFIANCVLHWADIAVLDAIKCRRKTLGPVRYLRYCDDIIILAPNREACLTAFRAYQEALRKLQLPAHAPSKLDKYDAKFWDGKSRDPYFWANPSNNPSTVPWIQFVGYQMRWDGMIRVKPKSIEKHKTNILAETDKLLRVLYPKIEGKSKVPHRDLPLSPCVRKSAKQIIHRFRQKLIAMSVGRRRVYDDLEKLMPKCWAIGFKMTQGRRDSMRILRELDLFREQQIRRIVSRLTKRPPDESKSIPPRTGDFLKYYGNPFSYVAQFIGRRRGTGLANTTNNRASTILLVRPRFGGLGMPLTELKKLLHEPCRRHRVKSLKVFGFHAPGDLTKECELVLLVQFKWMPPADYGTHYLGLRHDLQDVLGPAVDLGASGSVSAPFERNGRGNGVLVYKG